MKNLLVGVLAIGIVILGFLYYKEKKQERESFEERTALIQEQIRNVGKLVVTEGTFSQVYSYKNSKSFYLDIFSARKKGAYRGQCRG